MGGELILIDNVKEKKELLENLNKEYILIFEEKEDLINKYKVGLEAKYLSYFGGLIRKKFQFNIKYRRLKAKLTKIIAALNKGENIDLDKIEIDLEKELEKYYEELNEFNDKLKYSKEYIESPILTKEELSEIKSIFRSLVKKLHPDIAGDLREYERILWKQVIEAYDNNDLVTLIVLQDIVFKEAKTNENVDYNKLDDSIKRIREEIIKIRSFIEKTKMEFPFDIEDKLDDVNFINNKKNSLTKEIEVLREETETLNFKISKFI